MPRGLYPHQPRPLAPRLWARIDQTATCWLWTGHTSGGYGRIHVNGKQQYVHRVMFEMAVGPIPDDLELDHLCRVRHCVNPDHLEPVTHEENLRRGNDPRVNNYNSRKTHCAHGHPFDADNTRYTNGHRKCRACAREQARRAHLRATQGRKGKGPAQGESVATAKLNADQVRVLRARYAAGATLADLAREFGLNPSTVSCIITRKTWKHVE